MEYVNLNSVIDAENIESSKKLELLNLYDATTPDTTVILTNKLELLRRAELLDDARRNN